MRNIEYEYDATKELQKLVSEDRRAALKFFELLEDISRTPFEGKGKPEPLKGNLTGYWSRQISEKHRLVYKIDDHTDNIVIAMCYGHYGNK